MNGIVGGFSVFCLLCASFCLWPLPTPFSYTTKQKQAFQVPRWQCEYPAYTDPSFDPDNTSKDVKLCSNNENILETCCYLRIKCWQFFLNTFHSLPVEDISIVVINEFSCLVRKPLQGCSNYTFSLHCLISLCPAQLVHALNCETNRIASAGIVRGDHCFNNQGLIISHACSVIIKVVLQASCLLSTLLLLFPLNVWPNIGEAPV